MLLRGNKKFIREIDASLDQTVDIPVGKYKGIRVVSTTIECATGVLFTASYQLFFGGKTTQDLQITQLHDINNAFRGKPSYAVNVGAGVGGDDIVSIGYTIPFEFEDPNAIDIGENDVMNLRYVAGNVERGTIRFYGILSDYQTENYIPFIQTLQQTGDGRVRIDVPTRNNKYLFVYGRDPADGMEIYCDGKQKESVIPIQDAYDWSEEDYNLEAGDLLCAITDLSPDADKILTDALNDDVYVLMQHLANGTSTVISISYDYDITRLKRSDLRQAIMIDTENRRKIQKDKDRAIMLNPRELPPGTTGSGALNSYISNNALNAGTEG